MANRKLEATNKENNMLTIKKSKQAWWNPFRSWSDSTTRIMDAKCWWDTPSIVHPAPFAVALLSAILLRTLPSDILSHNDILRGFTDVMSRLVPGITVFANNISSQPVLLVHALNWLFMPYWLWLTFKAWPLFCIRFQPRFGIIRNPRWLNEFKARPEFQRTRKKIFVAVLFLPIFLPLGVWVIWSGFMFVGGPPVLARGLVYENLLQLVFWNWFLIQALVSIIFLAVFMIVMLPIHIRYILTGEIR